MLHSRFHPGLAWIQRIRVEAALPAHIEFGADGVGSRSLLKPSYPKDCTVEKNLKLSAEYFRI